MAKITGRRAFFSPPNGSSDGSQAFAGIIVVGRAAARARVRQPTSRLFARDQRDEGADRLWSGRSARRAEKANRWLVDRPSFRFIPSARTRAPIKSQTCCSSSRLALASAELASQQQQRRRQASSASCWAQSGLTATNISRRARRPANELSTHESPSSSNYARSAGRQASSPSSQSAPVGARGFFAIRAVSRATRSSGKVREKGKFIGRTLFALRSSRLNRASGSRSLADWPANCTRANSLPPPMID